MNMKRLASLILFLIAVNSAQAQLAVRIKQLSPDTVFTWTGYNTLHDLYSISEDRYYEMYYKRVMFKVLDSTHIFKTPKALVAVDGKGNILTVALPTVSTAVNIIAGTGIIVTGTYPNITISAYVPTINNSVSRTLNSSYTISSTKSSTVFYTVSISCSATLTNAASGTVQLQYSVNGGTTWVTPTSIGNSSSYSLAVAIGGTNVQQSILSGVIPVNALVKIVSSTSGAGTTTITYNTGQEIY